MSGGWFGTPLYVSPEQVKGMTGNEQSDVYAIAVILYEIMTGRVPFQGESTHAIMMQHINAVPMPPSMLNPQISPLVSAALLRGLAKNPADRFPNATALAEVLSNATQISVPLEREAGTWGKQAEPVPSTGAEPRLTRPVLSSLPSLVLFAPPSSPFLHASLNNTPGAYAGNPGESDATILRSGTTPYLQSAPLSPPPAFVPPVSPPASINTTRRRKRGGYIVLVLSLLVVLIGGGLGLFFLLNAMIQSPGFTAGQRALAIRIDTGIKNAIFWLEKVRQDTQQLVNRTNDQLEADPVLSDLDSIASEALNAFVGRIDPATRNIQEGVIEVHFNNQCLATFDVQPSQV